MSWAYYILSDLAWIPHGHSIDALHHRVFAFLHCGYLTGHGNKWELGNVSKQSFRTLSDP